MKIVALEKRLMLDASLGALISSTVLAEDSVNATPEVIDGDVTISGTTTDFTGEDLTISTTGGAEDQLTIIDEGLGAGQIGFDGTNIRYEGTIIGTLSSNGANGADLTISLNVNASQAAIERLIENVTYQNVSDAPTTARTVNISLGAFFSEDVSITIVPQNDDLVLAANNGVTVTEGASTLITTADLNVTDVDDANTDLVFTVTSTVNNGRLELTTNTGVAITSFTMDDVVNNRVQYVHNDTDTTSDSFNFTVTDGDTTLAAETFDITITSVNDPLAFNVNSGTTVFQGFSTLIGAEGTQFGTELLRYSAVGNYGTWDGTVDNKSLQYAMVFTTPAATPNGVPGETLFESGGSGVGIGLYLNSNFELDFYSGSAQSTPRLSSDALNAGTQYAVVVEIDQTTNEIRMHYQQTGDMSWYTYGRTAEKTLGGYTTTDHSGSNGTGVGVLNSSPGGYNGSQSGQRDFQGSIDSDLVITEFPSVSNQNTMLVYTDTDTSPNNIIYTITTDVSNGTLFRNGVALGLGDTFNQADLDLGAITYTNAGGLTESFDYSVTDGGTILTGTFVITIDTSNVAPEILTTTTILDEDFEGGASGWNNNTTTTDTVLSRFWGQFNRNIDTPTDQDLFRTFATSGTQDYIIVEFDFYELDSWDNEYFYAFVNDTQVLSNHRYNQGTFDQEGGGVTGDVTYNAQSTTQQIGYIAGNAANYDQIVHYTLIIDTSDPTFKLGFGSSLNGTNINDESFGIDNLKITEVKKAGTDAQEFYLSEFAANGDTVGTVLAVDENAGQPITYSITGGTGSAFFSIDPSTGAITVTDNSTFDYETITSYTLDVRATDTILNDTQTITINMLDVLENTRPNVNGATFSISEDAANNDDVGTVTSTDPEGDTVTYSIVGGSGQGIFKIDAITGLVEVLDATQLDYDTTSSYTLTIRGTDDNDLSLFHNRNITINLIDVDEAPSLNIQTVIETANPGVFYSSATGNFYMVDTTNRNFNSSLSFAESQTLNGATGHMLTITSAAEMVFVRDNVSPTHVWLALSDAAEEGKWIWVSGPEAGMQLSQGNTDAAGYYNNWTGSEPNSGTGSNYGLMNANSNWQDDGNGSTRNVVVEWEGKDVINNSYYRVNHTNADASDVSNGDSIGFVQGLDPEGDALDFSIQGGNADGIFEIDIATGEIRILDTTNLDATVQDTYVLTIRATENAGVKFDEINITIKFNDDFSISANNPISVSEAGTTALTTADLNISDLDGVAADTRFHVSTLPSNGQLEHSSNPGFQISNFTLDDLQNGRISFVHDGTETTTDSFVFEVTDGGRVLSAQTFDITIIPVNDAPVIATNTGAPITEGASTTITSAMLNGTDIDDVNTGLTYTVSGILNGHIEVNGVIQTTFTQDDINNNRVVFVHDGGEGTTRFNFSLADGGEDGAAAATGTFNFTVTAVNDTPIITTNTGASVVEGSFVTVTTAMLNVTDPDDSGTGLVYTLSNINNGQVVLSTAPGTPIISFTQADLVANRVRFVHDGGENNARFDVSVADGGENGAVADTATFNLTRIPVNDSPTIGVNAGSSVNQNSIVLLKRAVLRAADPDDSGVGLTFTITGTANGQLEYLSNPNVAITSFTQDDIDNSRVVFRHSGATAGTYFDFSIADGGEDGATAATGRFNLTVDNVNDAPIISTNTGPTVAEGSATVLTTAMLDSFDPDDFGTGLTWTVSNLVNGVIQVSGVTQTTFTQADLDAGIVTFVHDGSETITARFDVSLADGGENGAAPDTDTFIMTVTPVNDAPTLVVNDGTPNVIDFNDYPVGTFDAGQDTPGATAVASGDGSTLTITGNAWKKIDIPYTLTANTVLSFEFFSEDVGEIYGIGFDDDNNHANDLLGYQLAGTQTWGIVDQSYNNYSVGDGWVRYDIPIGADYTGVMDKLVFVLDKDSGPAAQIQFRNVNFYEADQVVSVNEGGTFNITAAHITSVDPDDSGTGLTYTATNITNGVVQVSGVTTTTFTQDDINNNRVTFVHDGGNSLNAGFDISLADGGENGALADTGSFTLIVNPINDAPTLDTNTGGTMNEGASLNITSAMLSGSDSDDGAGNLTYTASAITNGVIQVSGVTRTTFTQYDVDQGRVRFVHNDSQTTSAGFNFSLADGGENGAAADTGTFSIAVTPVNDAPVISVNTGATFNEGATLTVTSAMLNSTDPDDATTARTYTASSLSNGIIQVSGVTQNTFTQDDINNNRVTFIHDDSQTTAASFAFSLADGGEDSAAPATGTFNMTITPINDAPTITANTGGTMNEGATLNITSAMLNSADVDDAATDRTYTASSITNGVVQVSGVTQTTFTQDDINNNRVTFIHDDSQTTAASFAFSLADGGENSAAAATGTFNIAVTAVNDQAVLAANIGANITESGTVTITNALLNTTDVDDSGAGLVYTITSKENGWIELTTKVGYPVTSFTQADINANRVVFRHDGSSAGTAEFGFSVADGGENGTSPITGTFAVNVNTAVNEAPVIAITDGAPTTVDFGSATISPYDPSGAGDGQGSTATSYEVSTDGSVLTIYGNAWKKIPMPITLTADTVLTFDFRSTKEGEIHGIGFETDDVIGNGSYSYELFGTDANGLFDQSYNTYNLGDGWTRFEIPIGADFTGAVTDLFFMADDDAGADAISQFRNVSIYETNPTVTVLEGGSVAITNNNLNMFDTDDNAAGVTYTASAITNGHIEVSGVTATTFTQADVDNGLVFFIHDDSQTTTASFNLSLADGLENGAAADTATFNITVTPENDAPTIDTNLGATVAEGGSIVMSNTRLASSDVDNADAGLTYTITALPGGVFENTNTASVLGVSDTFTQGDIDNGFIRYTHDGGESSSERVTVTLSDGSATLTAVDFTWNITRVNDTPTNLGLTDMMIDEDADIGAWIGDLYTIDADLPGDTFTYSIMSDPDNKFTIVGNQLFVNAELDFETSTFHSVTIRTNDNNGGTFDRLMTITVLDINETPFIAPSTGRGPGGNFNGIVIEDDFRRGRATGALLEAAFSEGGLEGAFYGEGGIGQILRERTTVEIREMTNDNEIGESADPVKELVEGASKEPTLEEIEAEGDYTNLRQMLEALQNFAEDDGGAEGEGGGAEDGGEATIKDEKFHNLYDQFEDVLTYHEQKKEKLRQALLSE